MQVSNGKWNYFSSELSQILFDIITFSLSFVIFFYLRFESGFFQKTVDYNFSDLIVVNSVMTIYWLTAFWSTGLYRNMYAISPFEELWKVIKTGVVGSFFIFFLVFMDSSDAPRMLMLLYILILIPTVFVGRFISRIIQRKLRKYRKIANPTIVIASKSQGKDILDKLSNSPAWGLMPVGFVHIRKDEFIDDTNNMLGEYPILGHIEFIPEILDTYKPKEIIIADDSSNHDNLMKIAAYCIKNNIKVKIPPSLYDVFTGQARTFPLYGIPFIEINTQLLKPWEEAIKRMIDIVFSALVLILGSPFWALLALGVKLDSPGGVFYTQPRVGKNGRIFTIYKLRSMVSNANALGGLWTSVNDNRVTKFGRFIRKSHLDEVPQFWNVLIGDMSIVGPRPERAEIVDKYMEVLPIYGRRHLVRPGITGWWQVNYEPYQESLDEIKNRLKDDFYYIENMSIKLDIEIIIRTVFVVLKGHGQA